MKQLIGDFELHNIQTFLRKRITEQDSRAIPDIEFCKVNVEFVSDCALDGALGAYNPKTRNIRINDTLPEGLHTESTLAHEYAHYIQHTCDRYVMLAGLHRKLKHTVFNQMVKEFHKTPYFVRSTEVDARFAEAYYTYRQCHKNPQVVELMGEETFVFPDKSEEAVIKYRNVYAKYINLILDEEFAGYMKDVLFKLADQYIY